MLNYLQQRRMRGARIVNLDLEKSKTQTKTRISYLHGRKENTLSDKKRYIDFLKRSREERDVKMKQIRKKLLKALNFCRGNIQSYIRCVLFTEPENVRRT